LATSATGFTQRPNKFSGRRPGSYGRANLYRF
jgi:hypothetical protein